MKQAIIALTTDVCVTPDKKHCTEKPYLRFFSSNKTFSLDQSSESHELKRSAHELNHSAHELKRSAHELKRSAQPFSSWDSNI